MLFLILAPVSVWAFSMDDLEGAAEYYYGGEITRQNWKVCWIDAGPFSIPLPFRYMEVTLEKPQPQQPEISKLYYVYGVSQTLLRGRREVTSQALGTFFPQADDLFRLACKNRDKLKNCCNADGVIFKVGTGCKTGEVPGTRKCKA